MIVYTNNIGSVSFRNILILRGQSRCKDGICGDFGEEFLPNIEIICQVFLIKW